MALQIARGLQCHNGTNAALEAQEQTMEKQGILRNAQAPEANILDSS